MRVTYPYRHKLTHCLPHFRCEQWVYEWFHKQAAQQKLSIGELQRIAMDTFARSGWPHE